MKALQLYMCEYCGTQYKDKKECEKCESNHKSAVKIKNMKFHADKKTNYPDRLEVEMSDGKIYWYHR